MSDSANSTVDPPAASADRSAVSQAQVAALIVFALTIIAAGSITAALIDKSIAAVAFGAVGVVVGSLATALNAPSGQASVIAAAKKPDPQP